MTDPIPDPETPVVLTLGDFDEVLAEVSDAADALTTHGVPDRAEHYAAGKRDGAMHAVTALEARATNLADYDPDE